MAEPLDAYEVIDALVEQQMGLIDKVADQLTADVEIRQESDGNGGFSFRIKQRGLFLMGLSMIVGLVYVNYQVNLIAKGQEATNAALIKITTMAESNKEAVSYLRGLHDGSKRGGKP